MAITSAMKSAATNIFLICSLSSGSLCWSCILFSGSKTKIKGKDMEKSSKRRHKPTQRDCDLLFAGEQDDFSLLAVQANCRHKPIRNTENVKGPWGYQALPKVVKHQHLATVGHCRTDMGPILNSKQIAEQWDPLPPADLMNPNTFVLFESGAQELINLLLMITTKTISFSVACLHSGIWQYRCLWVSLANQTWNHN